LTVDGKGLMVNAKSDLHFSMVYQFDAGLIYNYESVIYNIGNGQNCSKLNA